MADTRQAWDEVADRLSGLALKLKLHFEQAAEAHPDGEAVKESLERLRHSVDDAFAAIGNAAKDPAVKDDTVEAARALSDALSATFTQISEDLRECFEPKKKSA